MGRRASGAFGGGRFHLDHRVFTCEAPSDPNPRPRDGVGMRSGALPGVLGVFGTLLGVFTVAGALIALDSSPIVATVAGLIAGAWSGGCVVLLVLLALPARSSSKSLARAVRALQRIDDPGVPLELTDGADELLAEIQTSTLRVHERHRRLEQQLAEKTEELGRERQLVRRLREQMRQSLSVQDAFLSRMSHELRTPLNAITGYVEILLEEVDPMWADDLGRVRLASMNLTALVTSVLDLTDLQSESYAVRPEPVVLEDLIRQVVDSVRFTSDTNRNRIEVDVDLGLVPVTDRRMLLSILFNLVSNAAKYTVDGSVRVTAARAADPGDGRLLDIVEITVSDTGIGMTPRQIEEAFRPFTQADASSTRRYDGSGVGLAVVKGFVEAMSGTVELQSEPGKGARVVVRLPFVTPARAGSGDIGEEEPTVFVR